MISMGPGLRMALGTSRRIPVVCDRLRAKIGLLRLPLFHAEKEPPDVCCTIYASISLQRAGGLGG
jgi:hypothetical protein